MSPQPQFSTVREGPNRALCLKKHGEGCEHVQAFIALARRRVSVLWALLRERWIFTATPSIRDGASCAAYRGEA
ncbi:hypothetical protein [Streptomyces sp. NPDC058394]|uniref:hypothetical protein n=1 Tax=Streptomyces sp. NPDC058394 TaxID=3346477 RepID=UPI003658761D